MFLFIFNFNEIITEIITHLKNIFIFEMINIEISLTSFLVILKNLKYLLAYLNFFIS